MGADGVPCLAAEPGRRGARAPSRIVASECRLSAGDRGLAHCLPILEIALLRNSSLKYYVKTFQAHTLDKGGTPSLLHITVSFT